MTRNRRALACCAVGLLTPAAFVLSTRTVGSQETSLTHSHDAFSWTKGYSLIVTRNATLEAANETVDFINSHGGQVAVIVSPRLMLGWAPASLAGHRDIRSIHTTTVAGGVFRPRNIDEADAVGFFNQVVSGAWEQSKQGLSDHDRVVDYPPDAFDGPPSTGGLRGNGPGIAGSRSPGNADMMVGKANFNAIFVESNGAIDPNTYTWSCAAVSTIVSEISASLSFWSSRASTYGVPLGWIASYHRPPQCPGTTSVLTSYEPITRSSGDDGLWISEIMCNFGHCSGDKFARTNAFNTARRLATSTNWATTSFIGYNPSPAPTTFSDSFFAYAYRSGHYSQLLFRNNGWAISQYDLVNAHETGHLFGTFDEYASSQCNNCFTSDALSKDVVNGNCANCGDPSVSCIMRNNELSLCGYTPGQVGWGLDINHAYAAGSTGEQKNFVPGQAVAYFVTVDVPGRTGECVTVHSRWYRQFQSNLTESESFVSPCLVTTGATWNIFLPGRTVPAGAQYGEAALEVQLEFVYATAPNAYGRGMRGSSRGGFVVLLGGANPIPISPTVEDVFGIADGPQAVPVAPRQP